MTEEQFRREVARAETMRQLGEADEQAYWEGYLRGVRRVYHGARYGSEAEHEAMRRETGDAIRERRRRGYLDALALDQALGAASAFGRLGGQAKGPRKAAAARANGARGGRPRKTTA